MTDGAPEFGSSADVAPASSNAPLAILFTGGTSGDMLPFIAVAQGLRDRGHRVLMVVPASHEPTVQAAGIACRTFGTREQAQAMLDDPDLWDDRKGLGVIWNSLTPNLGAFRQVIQDLPSHEACVVLSHPLLVPMAALARSLRPELRIVTACLAPSNVFSSHDMLTAGSSHIPRWVPLAWRKALWRVVDKLWVGPVTLPSLNAARTRYKLPPVPRFLEHIVKAPDAALGLFPKWFAASQPDWPQPFTEGDFVSATQEGLPSLSPELEQFLSDGDPPIVFTPGTGHQHAARQFSTALTALERLGRRGLFVTPHVAQLPDSLPTNVMWQAHAPFSALLQRTAAVVHHGGIGTTAEAFRAGIPQLIVPYAYDQFDNGLRAKQMGVADVLLAKRLSARRMHRQLEQLLSSEQVRQACHAVAQKMARKPDLAWLLDRVEAALFDSRPAGATLMTSSPPSSTHDEAAQCVPETD